MTDDTTNFAELIPLLDAVCDYGDSQCRAFPIETAPNEIGFLAWSSIEEEWMQFACRAELQFVRTFGNDGYTHWRPLPPPPSNPPLPAVFSDLGAALERLKGA